MSGKNSSKNIKEIKMKMLKVLVLELFITNVVFLSSPLFADKAHEQEMIQLLNDSAAALKATNASLSSDLTKYAEDLAKSSHHIARIKLLINAADALKQTNPDLSDRLRKMSDRHEKRDTNKK